MMGDYLLAGMAALFICYGLFEALKLEKGAMVCLMGVFFFNRH